MASAASTGDDSFYYDHLAQLAAARTNPYAVRVAAEICKGFKLSVGGQRRLNKALNDLPCIDTLDPNLSFAWSTEHAIRNPQVHRIGYEHLTIITTLSECFHETYAAEVFHQLAKRSLPSSQTTPHIYQWLDLLHFCNGILATGDFGLVVESFILLDPYSVTPGGKYAADRCLVPPESVANAMIALSELSRGKRSTLTLRGGGVIGFLAALAEQFFDITVMIESKQGEHLHGPRDGAQLNLVYTEKPELIIEDSSTTAAGQETTSINVTAFPKQIHFLPYGGRVTWSTLLPQIFGQTFRDLDQAYGKTMYTAIGAAFRAIENAKDASTIKPKQGSHASLSPHAPEVPALQLITTLTTYLSSLQHGQARMERALRLSSQEAAKTYFEQIRHLSSICKCVVCSKVADKPLPPIAEGQNDVPTTEHHGSVGYCVPAVVETIVMVGLMLSRVVLAQPINPSREGVQLLYKLRADRLASMTETEALSGSPNAVAALYDNALDAPASQILRMAVKFFAGGHLPPLGSDLLPSEVVAIAHEGMCAFVAELAGGRNVRTDMKGMVRVINGGFGIRQKTYRLAAWSAQRPGGREGWAWDGVEVEHLKDVPGGKLWVK